MIIFRSFAKAKLPQILSAIEKLNVEFFFFRSRHFMEFSIQRYHFSFDLDVVAGVPVAVVIKAAGQYKCGRRSAECGIALASPPRTELFQIVAAINDAGVEEAAGFSPTSLTRLCHPLPLPRARDIALTPALSRPTGEGVFVSGNFAPWGLGG